MKVVLFGPTGMIGAGALLECLASPIVSAVAAITRSPTGKSHPKLTEVIHQDFFDYARLGTTLSGCEACLFCLGVSAVGLNEDRYSRLTHDLTLAAAAAVLEASPSAVFCYVSGAGTDSTERGRAMWARVKGRTENALLAMPFRAAYMFRPGYIQPRKGIRSKTRWYQAFYSILGPFYPQLHRLFPRYTTTTEHLGRALIAAAAWGYPRRILDSPDINDLSALAAASTAGSLPPAPPTGVRG